MTRNLPDLVLFHHDNIAAYLSHCAKANFLSLDWHADIIPHSAMFFPIPPNM